MHSDEYELDPEGPPPGRRWQVFSLPAVMAVGWLIYEVSHSPGLAAMVMCLKFGWEDFRTALWLRRRDPWPERGRAARMVYVASGMWKAAMVGIVMVFATLVASGIANGGKGVPVGNLNAAQAVKDIETLILGAFGATMFGQAIACLACARGMGIARRNRIPLWLSGAVHFARHRDDWPPLYGHHNRLRWLSACCFLFNLLIFTPIAALLAAGFINNTLGLPVPTGLVFALFFLAYLRRAIMLASRHRSLGIVARHPSACWLKEAPADGDR